MPFVNQQFSLQVVERGRAVQFVKNSLQAKTSAQPAGTALTDDQTPCTQHARRRSYAPGHPRASVASLLYADGHVAHDAPCAV